MERSKKMNSIRWFRRLLIAGIVIAALWGAYCKYGAITLEQSHAADIASYADVFSLSGLHAEDGWITYTEKKLEDGIWHGGISEDGSVISCAQSSTKHTRVYTRIGAWDTKHWGSWANIGEKSAKQVSVRFGTAEPILLGTWYGYEAK